MDLGLDSPLQPAHFSELSLSRTRALSRRCRREFFECNASLERRGCSGPILRHEAHPAPVGSSVSRARWECKRSEARKRRGCISGSSEGLDSATSTRRKKRRFSSSPSPTPGDSSLRCLFEGRRRGNKYRLQVSFLIYFLVLGL